MNSDILIRADNCGKRFCRNLKRSLMYGVQDIACDLLGKDRSNAGLRKSEFWANEGISFELRRGECLGLIGHNGAGKTTLLKMINGLIRPDTGRIQVQGRVGALIALGAGFNPVLTGRENVFIAGSVLGLSKREIHQKYEEIVDFSGLAEFMESPVQSYSSGMQVRLGFSVATTFQPDILLIDEVLAVGDSDFREKCSLRISERLSTAAVIFVSHNDVLMSRICTHGLYLEKGRPLMLDEIDKSLMQYQSDQAKKRGNNTAIKNLGPGIVDFDVKVLGSKDLQPGEDLELEIPYHCESHIAAEEVMISIEDMRKQAAAQAFCTLRGGIAAGSGKLHISIRNLRLKADDYFVTVALFAKGRQTTLARIRCGDRFITRSHVGVYCPYIPVAELLGT